MPATPTRALAVLAFALVAAACSSAPVDTEAGAPASSSPPATSPTKGVSDSETPAADPVELLDFEAPLLGGGTFDGTSLAGKDVAFWFWAPW